MLVQKIQQFFDGLSQDENEQEAFLMFGVIFSLLFLVIIGVATGQTLALML